MKLHCFLCASPLFPDDRLRDQELHSQYYKKNREATPDDVMLSVIQNGCTFPIQEGGCIRNPFVKSIAYNWLLCDANCQGDYWLFLPEDCLVKPEGWREIQRHMRKGKECFGLSKDPKGLVAKQGVFQSISKEVQVVCDMNFLGKEIGGAVLRQALGKRGFHCISKNWKKISSNPDLWGNELYALMNVPDHPEINRTLNLPIFQDYGFDGWKATKEELESTFMKIVSRSLELQRQQADSVKSLIAHFGPLISELPYKGPWSEFMARFKK